MSRILVMLVSLLAGASVGWAQPGPGGGHPRGGDRPASADHVPAHQREELRDLIRAQRAAAREDERAQRNQERSQRQLSPQEREVLREQLRQQRRDQRSQP